MAVKNFDDHHQPTKKDVDLNSIRIIRHVDIPMPDGVVLSARMWLPETAEQHAVPAIFEFIPYRKNDMVHERDAKNHAWFARNGYAGIRVDMRGTGDSEGFMHDMYEQAELNDAIHIIEWIAEQSWCNGSVGMMGTSWGGTASLQAASRKPDALKAIIAVCSTNNRFEDDIHYSGGAVLTDTVEWGATLPAIIASPPDPTTPDEGWHDQWLQRLENLSFPLVNWIKHNYKDDYWRYGSIHDSSDEISCPVLMIGGWVDRYSNSVMNLLSEGPDNVWGIIGSWGHHYPDAGKPGPSISFQQEALRWWDHWLRGVKNDVEKDPKLRVWCNSYQTPQDVIQTRQGRWVAEQTWPSGNTIHRKYWLHDGLLKTTAPDEQKSIPVPNDLRVGKAAGDTGYFGRPGGLALDQRQDDARSCCFETDILAEDVQILGQPEFHCDYICHERDAQIVVRLIDVAPDGGCARVGWVVKNLALNDGNTAVSSKEDSKPQTVKISLQNCCYLFKKGHKIRIAISTSYWPLVWPTSEDAELQILLDNSFFLLPERKIDHAEQSCSFLEKVSYPEDAVTEVLNNPPIKRWREDTEDQHTVAYCWHQPFFNILIKETGLEFGYETKATNIIQVHDRCKAASRIDHIKKFKHKQWTAEIHSYAELCSTDVSFFIKGQVEVYENDRKIFNRSWDYDVPRLKS